MPSGFKNRGKDLGTGFKNRGPVIPGGKFTNRGAEDQAGRTFKNRGQAWFPGGFVNRGPVNLEDSLAVPTGFGTVPFNAKIYENGGVYSTNFDPTAYRLTEGGDGVTTYYVDKATGVDTNAGTSAAPFKTIFKAISIGRATTQKMLIKVKGGNYYLTENFNNKVPEAMYLSVISWDGQPVICTNENPNIVPASWTLDSDNTYWASVASYGYSEYRSSVWDGSVGDAFGDDVPLVPAASIVACKASAGTYYTDQASLRVYVHTLDNRAPDADIHVYEAWNTPGQYTDYPAAPQAGNCYFENIHFRGGASPFNLANTNATNKIIGVFYDCSFKYGAINRLVQVQGYIDVALVDCLAAAGHADGFSYHAYGGNTPPTAIEIGCEARMCGAILTGTANQGSTAHDGASIVRVNGNYHDNENDQVADVGTTKSWLLNCSATDGLKVNYAGFLAGNGVGATKMWLEACDVNGCTYDLNAGAGSTIYTKSFTGAASNTGAGTITTY